MTAWPESPKVPRGDVGGTLQGGRRLRGQGRPEREGGRSERSRRKRESRERGGTRGDARFGEDSPGRYLPLRSQKPERIQCPGEKAATAAAEPCPGDARAGTTHRACAVPPSGRASRGSQATTPASRRLGELSMPGFRGRLPPPLKGPFHQLSTPFSVHRFLTS